MPKDTNNTESSLAERSDSDTLLPVSPQSLFAAGSSFELTDATDVQSFEDLVEESSTIDEWELVDAAALVAVPFIIVGVSMNKTDLGAKGTYMNVKCITEDNAKVCFNDGGAGVYEQLRKILGSNANNGKPIRVRGGLRVSVFHYDAVANAITEGTPNASTFYLSGSQTASEKSRKLLASVGAYR